jgi:uncharacterized membrane protein YfcA
MEFSLLTVFVGLMVGFFVGLTGVGGGVILAPVLVFMGVQPTVAVGTDLVYGSVTKVVGTWRNTVEKRVDWPWVWALASGSIPGGIAGSYAIAWLRNSQGPGADYVVKVALGVVLLIASGLTIWLDLHPIKKPLPLVDLTPTGGSRPRKRVMLAGLTIGFAVGLTRSVRARSSRFFSC